MIFERKNQPNSFRIWYYDIISTILAVHLPSLGLLWGDDFCSFRTFSVLSYGDSTAKHLSTHYGPYPLRGLGFLGSVSLTLVCAAA